MTGITLPCILETHNLVTHFHTYEGVVKALNGVSLNVDHGLTFGLVGESGCGKSVFVRSVMRIIGPPGKIEGGRVLFNRRPDEPAESAASVDLLAQSEKFMETLRGDGISMIFQEPNAALNPIMRIGDQVAESFLFHRKREMCEAVLAELASPHCRMWPPMKRWLQWIYGKAAENPGRISLKLLSRVPVLKRWRRPLLREAERRAVEIIGKLGISNPDAVARRYPHNLSGGMKQRIVIAMALACGPSLLIADEATSNLDVTIQAQILELLRQLKETEISSVLLITHDLGVVAETCDRVGVMYAGNLCEVADVADLFHRPRHPYTHALLQAVPRMSQSGELESIPGSVPKLVDPPPGCRFHPRCPRAGDICEAVLPPLEEMSPGHFAACHFPINEER
jgi:peptide/nickel transport system ATP-binding protein